MKKLNIKPQAELRKVDDPEAKSTAHRVSAANSLAQHMNDIAAARKATQVPSVVRRSQLLVSCPAQIQLTCFGICL